MFFYIYLGGSNSTAPHMGVGKVEIEIEIEIERQVYRMTASRSPEGWQDRLCKYIQWGDIYISMLVC